MLVRLREECNQRFAKDREAFRQRLRLDDTSALVSALRQEIESVKTASREFDHVDIDVLVDEYLRELATSPYVQDDWIAEEELVDDIVVPTEWVRCPICSQGFLLMPFPGIISCDFCREMQLCVSNEGFGLSDLATALDGVIRNHSCPNFPKFIISNNVLFLICEKCDSNQVVL